MAKKKTPTHTYSDDSVTTLDWKEHIRRRPGMYIGKLGNGSEPDDGIYVLLKEVLDNSIDEYAMGAGTRIEVTLKDNIIRVRDYGRGIPLTKVVSCVSEINTGAKYTEGAFKYSVGLNGVGTKAVNALSEKFTVISYRDNKFVKACFEKGQVISETTPKKCPTKESDGTYVEFVPDTTIFEGYHYKDEFIKSMLQHYTYLNPDLVISFNGKEFISKNGILDLLSEHVQDELHYPLIHLKTKEFEVAFSHGEHYGEEYFSFVNGQNTTQGGTHVSAFKEALLKILRNYFKKQFEASDIRSGIVAAISIKIQEPVFESQTKTKLGSTNIGPQKDSQSIRVFIQNILQTQLDDFLHKNQKISDELLKKIVRNEKERKELKGIKKLARERNKKASVNNKKLRDCKVHYNTKHKKREDTMIFITEGNSASGSITKSRDPETQAVFSLKGKPLNCHGLTKRIVYENEELNLLVNALNIEEGMENLKYNKVILATDADVDGMHIRMLASTFFLRFFIELIQEKHLFILQTPLFRVRNNKTTKYCYSEAERDTALSKLGGSLEVTRFKGLGEISPEEFELFIKQGSIRLDPVTVEHESIEKTLNFYMGKNTPERQNFILENLRLNPENYD